MNIPKYIRKHKMTLAVLVIFILSILLFAFVYKILVPNNGKALYGDRLNNKVSIKEETYAQVKDNFSKKEIITKSTIDERGRLVNFIITVKDNASIQSAKELTNDLLKNFSEEQLKYYDFQIIITKNDENQKSFPIFGYKHHNNESFSWTKDRVNE